jgi:hypothetical protein
MKTWQTIRPALVALLATALFTPAAGLAGEEEAKDAKPPQQAEKPKSDAVALSPLDQPVLIASNMPLFVLQNRGAPMARLGGATRSTGQPAHPRIEALVPEQPGWTLEAQPTLYWFVSEVPQVPVEFTLMRLDPHETLVETRLPAPSRAGVQRIALADHAASLETGASYQWLVKLVPNPQDRSYDQIVGGGIERVAPSDSRRPASGTTRWTASRAPSTPRPTTRPW